jgi:periplasmic protein CpxP/Spy
MKRTWKIALAVAGVLVVGGVALASEHAHEGFFNRRVTHHIDAALDAVSATPAQRDAVHAARDHVFATMAESRQAGRADLDAALALWEADRIDTARLAALRAQHRAAAKKVGDAVVQALSDAHDALTAPQRQKLADYLRANRPPRLDGARPWMKRMADERVADMLDQIHATADQRTRITAAVTRALDAVGADLGGRGEHFDEAIAVFTADRLDATKIAALEGERQARMEKAGDQVAQALTEIHDALDAGQRKQVADFVRSHHLGHRG